MQGRSQGGHSSYCSELNLACFCNAWGLNPKPCRFEFVEPFLDIILLSPDGSPKPLDPEPCCLQDGRCEGANAGRHRPIPCRNQHGAVGFGLGAFRLWGTGVGQMLLHFPTWVLFKGKSNVQCNHDSVKVAENSDISLCFSRNSEGTHTQSSAKLNYNTHNNNGTTAKSFRSQVQPMVERDEASRKPKFTVEFHLSVSDDVRFVWFGFELFCEFESVFGAS